MGIWKIDTIDPRGGLAFASSRKESDLHTGDKVNGDAPCIFVGAPEFRPETVSSRSIALSAGRSAFQTGLFFGAEGMEEVTFPSPDAVAEFVRRTYLRSGGGDGAEEDRWPFPRNDIPGVFDLLHGHYNSRTRRKLREAIGEFQTLASNRDGQAKPVKTWENLRSDFAAGPDDTPDMLAAAALNLIFELYSRLPKPTSRTNPTNTKLLLLWQREAQHLRDLVTRLDLWPLLLEVPYFDGLRILAQQLRHAVNAPGAASPSDVVNENEWPFFFLFGLLAQVDPQSWPDDDFIFQKFWHPYYGGLWLQPWTAVDVDRDPLASLWRLPLPQRVEKFVGSPVRDRRASVYNALAAMLGAPRLPDTNGTPYDYQEFIDLALFASACIVVSSVGRPLRLFDWTISLRPMRSSIAKAAAQNLADHAWRWMSEHLPQIAFAQHVEDAIAQAADLQYR